MWNTSILTRTTLTTEASFELGEGTLDALQERIEQEIAFGMADLVSRLAKDYPVLRVQVFNR